MKAVFSVLIFVATSASYALELNCNSARNGIPLSLTATWVPGETLSNIKEIYNEVTTSYVAAPRQSYSPTNPRYQNMDRFKLNNEGWSSTSLLLPKQISNESPFRGYYYDQGEAGLGTIPLKCTAL